MDTHRTGTRLFVTGLVLMVLLTCANFSAIPASAQIPATEPAAPSGASPAFSSLPPRSYPGTPYYDSGWQVISPGQTLTLTHNLGDFTNNYVVDLSFSGAPTPVDTFGINQAMYGGNQFRAPAPTGFATDDMVGAYWHSLTTTSIKVYRMPQDKMLADKIRVRIWVATDESFDSGWLNVTAPTVRIVNFTIANGLADNYLVYLEFKNNILSTQPPYSLGIHQRYYGGTSLANSDRVGAYWQELTNTAISINVQPQETRIDEVRVRIWLQPKPTYDSGWNGLTSGNYLTITHNLGGNPDAYIVDLQFKDLTYYGVNQRCYGGCDLRANNGVFSNTDQGAYWRQLTSSKIQIGRRSQDTFADQVRVRIWNVWKPTPPAYDSGWKTSALGTPVTLNHGLGGSADDYLVTLDSKSPLFKTHQMYFGGKQLGARPSNSEDDLVGIYWRSLTNASVVVYHLPNDYTADQWRLRIWKMPEPDYDSGWEPIAAGSSHPFIHKLAGDPSDFLVDMSFKDLDTAGSGVNQRYFGGIVTSTNNYYGVQWFSFTTIPPNNYIVAYRFPNDNTADQVRIRIWRVSQPDYESGQISFATPGNKMVTHGLNKQPDQLFVDATARQPSGDHKNFYGRVDMGTGNPFGLADNDRVGYYWYGLTDNQLSIERMPEDHTVASINVRIWDVSLSVYLPMLQR